MDNITISRYCCVYWRTFIIKYLVCYVTGMYKFIVLKRVCVFYLHSFGGYCDTVCSVLELAIRCWYDSSFFHYFLSITKKFVSFSRILGTVHSHTCYWHVRYRLSSIVEYLNKFSDVSQITNDAGAMSPTDIYRNSCDFERIQFLCDVTLCVSLMFFRPCIIV